MSKLLARLHDASRSGVYRASSVRDIEEVAQGSDLDIAHIDAHDADLFASVARALEFPAWFGANWDALEDCLGDLSWRRGEGHVLVFRSYPSSEKLGTLVDVLRTSAEYWASQGKPFFAVLIDPAKKLSLPDLYRGA